MAIILSNFTPVGSHNSPEFIVSFDITSDGDSIDLSTLDVYFSETNFSTPAINNGDAGDGYDNVISSTVVDGNPGYNIIITSNRIHRNNTVAVQIDVDTTPAAVVTTFIKKFSTSNFVGVFVDTASLLGTDILSPTDSFPGVTFSGRDNNILFQINDKGEPIITGRNPTPNITGVVQSSSVLFSLHDAGGEGVNISTLDVYIEGLLTIIAGAFTPPHTGTISASTIDGFAGFSVNIDNTSIFPFSQVTDVRVVVDDVNEDLASINTLDTTYSFTIEPFIDREGPSASPTQPPDGLDPLGCIEFDWIDEPQGPGPDFNTLMVTLLRELTVDCITNITSDVAVIDGVAQDPSPGTPRYELFASPITLGLSVGYHIILCPVVPFNELETITVIVNGFDSSGSESTVDFSVSTKETTSPRVLNFSPPDGDISVDSQAGVSFDIHDFSGVGIDINTVNVDIDDSDVIIDGNIQPGFSLILAQKTVIDEIGLQFDGYGYQITRDVPWYPNKIIDVYIDGYDGYSNRVVESFSFTAEADLDPPVITIDPPNNATLRNRDQIVTIDVIDNLGVNKLKTDISIQGISAVANGIQISPFDVLISEISGTPGIIDGYRYSIDTENDFSFGETIVIDVSSEDNFLNTSSKQSSFLTFIDSVGPTITNVTPGDSQEEVSLMPEVTFIARDAYDIAFEMTDVTINSLPAIRSGIIQTGFSMNLSRISGGIEGVDPGDGYSVIITPDDNFEYNDTVSVYISVYDRSNKNNSVVSATWYTIRPRPPIFQIIPADGDIDFPVDGNIVFEIFDDGYNIDIGSLNVQIDAKDMIVSNVIQEPNYIGTIYTIADGLHYIVEVDPRFLLDGATTHEIILTVSESLSGNIGRDRVSFTTDPYPENPDTLYIGTDDGVKSILASDIGIDVQPDVIMDGYHVLCMKTLVLKGINRLLVGTRDTGAVIYNTNYSEPTMVYSVGDEITSVHISTSNNGTIYLANRTRTRVDVYYNILFDDVGRNTPDVFYAPPPAGPGDGYVIAGMIDGYFTSMVVDDNTSTIDSLSPRIFLGTTSGAMRIDTDESSIKNTEVNGVLYSYGIGGTGHSFDILDGTTNEIVALDVNTRLNYLYVATRSEDTNDVNYVTYIDLSSNTRDGSIGEDRLIDRLINDIDFKD